MKSFDQLLPRVHAPDGPELSVWRSDYKIPRFARHCHGSWGFVTRHSTIQPPYTLLGQRSTIGSELVPFCVSPSTFQF
jgi:hypothetical protein